MSHEQTEHPQCHPVPDLRGNLRGVFHLLVLPGPRRRQVSVPGHPGLGKQQNAGVRLGRSVSCSRRAVGCFDSLRGLQVRGIVTFT